MIMEIPGITTSINRYKRGLSLEQPFYIDQSFFEFEWQDIWKKNWLFAGTITGAIHLPFALPSVVF